MTWDIPFRDRRTAGEALASALLEFRERPEVIVLGLPRGGVPVAYEVASALGARLDLMLVRKLGAPGQKELAMGAIAGGGVRVLNEDVLRYRQISAEAVDAVVLEESQELQRRERAYRGERPWPQLAGQLVILVDDGLATGATMRAAIAATRQQAAAGIIVAAPVGPLETVTLLRRLVDQVVCLFIPEFFYAIGQWYRVFDQTSDQEVQALLQHAWAREAGSGGS
ncbi:phosphoribosyltransferase [Pseudomonas sp. 2FG]|uniref:phosphoribosyltransferase n=1 Tax=Pseudomonas sp. 2FG TaxID=2502191 RepID=UPI0010F65EF1|nr:phosphoribosyltransferase [Pseudomonas sp. 2FG]